MRHIRIGWLTKAAAAAYLVATTVAQASPDQATPATVGTPGATQAPAAAADQNPAPQMRYYPDRAQRLNIEGRTMLRCTVTADRRLTDCLVLKENPPGYGFAEASLKLATIFRLKPATKDGVPVGGRPYTFGISWKLPPATKPAPASTAPTTTPTTAPPPTSPPAANGLPPAPSVGASPVPQ